jgi:hypothetical protein
MLSSLPWNLVTSGLVHQERFAETFFAGVFLAGTDDASFGGDT